MEALLSTQLQDKWLNREPRYRVNAEVSVLSKFGRNLPFELYDLSCTGAWLVTPYLLELEEEIWVSLSIPGYTGHFTLPARVIRVSDHCNGKPWGMGVNFLISEQEKARIKKLLNIAHNVQ